MKSKLYVIFFLFFFANIWARPVVMLTGYWPPTSEMIYRFSNNPELNPDGWIGENWEGYGYDVYAFFPAFDITTREFEVDYQATWADFWGRAEEYNPEIIISFGAGAGPWEIETKATNLNSWNADDVAPYYPTPNPPDSTLAVNGYRYATLPVEEIAAAIDEQTSINGWVDTYGDPGDFLCNYIAYLGMWYHDMHADLNDPNYCRAAGFIHVDGGIDIDVVTEAAEITLRTTLDYFANINELAGNIIAGDDLAGCEITLTSSLGSAFEAVTDESGEFIIPEIPYDEYFVEARIGRYFYYQGEFGFNPESEYLEIEMQEFASSDPVSYSQGAEELINSDVAPLIFVGAHFPTELLQNYVDCHLNRFYFTAPENSEDCSLQLKLYRGNPDAVNISIVHSISLPEFEQGDLVEAWLDDFYILSQDDIDEGLTLSYGIVNSNNNIGYTDGETAHPNGNLMKVGTSWYHADTEYGISGNWDLALGFNGEPIVSASDNLVLDDYNLRTYPNPFNPSTKISFELPQSTKVILAIYNAKGQLIDRLLDKELEQGTHNYNWNGVDSYGKEVASGLYLYRLETETKQITQKLLLLK